MNPRGSAPPGACGRFLVAVDRRLRLARSLRVASWALLLPVAAALLLLLFGLRMPAATAAAATAAAALVVGLLAAGRRDLARAARAADRAADLHDLLKANLEIRDSHSESPWLPLLERRAEAAVATLEPSELVPIAPPRPALMLGALGLLSLAVVAWLSGSPRGASLLSMLGDGEPVRGASSGDEEPAAESGQEAAAAAESRPEKAPALPEATATGSEEAKTSLEEALGRAADGALEEGDGEPADAEGAGDGKAGDDSRAPAATATLRDERRTRAGNRSDEGENEGEQGGGSDEKVSGGESGGASEEAEGSEGSNMEAGEQASAIDPKSVARRARGKAGESPIQAGASAGQSQEAGEDGERSEPGESGSPGAGVGTAPQSGTTPPLGEATNLEVTLEEVLLAAQREKPAPERHSRPSRRAEEIAIASPASSRAAGPSTPGVELPALQVPYPLRDRALVREYFAPRPDAEDEASEAVEPKPSDESAPTASADQENP